MGLLQGGGGTPSSQTVCKGGTAGEEPVAGKVKKREFFPLHFLLPPFLFSRGKRESIASSGAAAAAVGFFTLPDEGGGGGVVWHCKEG